ncbi:MAG: PfaD family polyunsaturated fatty acid/polyketide biosynthesis protein [Alphaproteobacteria bacterium]|nr:PfaD family polyunsaturated fatty acid/polyketide biosynthesis protein [Alphaproteobacteria bacterium]MCB9793696.1 PfaD family polyunsaturated fatty acid/polyketide biosynthesis protein [Alphaproteobacteria bacterium]
MQSTQLPTIGAWTTSQGGPAFGARALMEAVQRVREPVHVVQDPQTGAVGVAFAGAAISREQVNGAPAWPLLGTLPPLYPEWLGDRAFCEVHRLRFPYVAGAMANGIHTADMTIAMAKAGMLGFFGSAGLPRPVVEEALDKIEAALGRADDGAPSWGSNLIHSPNEPDLEESIVELYLQRGVRRVSASAYMALTPYVVRYAATGLSQDAEGRIHRKNHLFAKISRPEVARRFMSPPPQEMLDALVAKGQLTASEAALARRLPVAEDIMVEADSGGHTDNQTLTALFGIIAALRDTLSAEHGYTRPIRVGAGGGLGTPSAVAAAFSLGAAFVLTGSVNQACVESGLSEAGKALLAQTGLADVVMAPAADMFELGVKVQVLRRGTMFGVRALKLYELYTGYASLDDIPAKEREKLERQILARPVDTVWADCEAYFSRRDPKELARAARDPKHKMALVFRWYLGQSSRWAISGAGDRRMDYQIWCGPAMGAFNDWVQGSFLAEPGNRRVVAVAHNLLEGAAVLTRAHQLRSYGAPLPPAAFRFHPRPLS